MNKTAKYIVYHDPQNNRSNEILNLVTSRVPEDLIRIVTGPLDKPQIKTIQYNLDIAERPTIMKDQSILTKEQKERIKKDDVDVLGNLLSGPEGYKNLVLPIVMCPVSGSIVVGPQKEKVIAILEEDGFSKVLATRNVVVNVVVAKSPTVASDQVGRYRIYHQDYNEKSQLAFDFLRINLVGGQFTIHVNPLDEKEASELVSMIKPPVEFLHMISKQGLSLLGASDIAKIERGDKSILSSRISGQQGLKIMTRPIFVDIQTRTLLVAPKVEDIIKLLESQGWKPTQRHRGSIMPLGDNESIASNQASIINDTSATASVIPGALKNGNMKYLIFHDQADAGSREIYDLMRYSVNMDDIHVVTAPLSQNDVKKIMHLLDPKEWIKLSKDPKILTKQEQESMIKSNDMNVLSALLCGEAGLKKLVRPILVCPVAGTIVVGPKLDEVSTLINNGGCLW